MTHYTIADLARADRHIAEGEAHIVKQEELITALQLKGLPTHEAETLLRLLNETQVEHWEHREAICEALAQSARKK